MTDRSAALSLLQRALDDAEASFREGQWEAIDALVNRQERLLVVQRTGWGKSSVYFIATRILRDRGRGPTLIVSPLLALMRNQIEAANRLGIRALTINSTNRNDWPALQDAVRVNQADALLISPERLANDDFVQNLLLPIAETIGLLVVDEAHCISDWGHDFRPDYRRLVNVLQRMPDNVPILGTTATANNRVVTDVRAQLGDIGIQRGALTRQTIALQTLHLPSQAARLAWLVEHINELPGTGIIYTLTKRDANQVADWLNQHGVPAKPYYSGVLGDGFVDSDVYREHLENQLLRNEIKALIATTALGMGYDKPDLGFVVHYQAPGSIVAYYQQVGRAGRSIGHAVGILMSGDEDDHIHEYFRSSAFPRERWVQSILEVLEESDGLTTTQLEEAVNLRHGQIEQVLKFLSVDNPAPVLKDGSKWQRTPVPFRMDHDRIQRLIEQREIEWGEIQAYIHEPRCLMEFLARALDDVNPQPCGKCANCLGRPVVEPSFARETAVLAGRFLRHSEIPLDCNKQVAKDAFAEYGFRGNLPLELRAETGRILSRWGDAGWGQVVADDKHAGRFRDELVDAVAEMLRDRWQPNPSPMWVTCVPSRNHPMLVPDFAARLANLLGLPFAPVVTKVKDNEPQKGQQNRFHQCRNLDGVFAIVGNVPDGPVLLVDDVVDSAWTMTVTAALLKRAGSGPVWPLALTTSSVGI
ncbi:RecQ family ATP-dependent DNA helicase [Sinorhizobium sp. 7-81]|uniref:RecQ family ATP-dependent DNA helicase n=1 Tax=Sinorhizobium sp. 8-89 TaxID=3049089 RepID=UPI0024C2859F|nr:RecQ family ATP-dependent DNA helicase [Sinorhizobium sp. 8-89]MDK1492954.1 RecQ family ATP-dependent DNA helicase [Sinorhizobium sp. 8-89]